MAEDDAAQAIDGLEVTFDSDDELGEVAASFNRLLDAVGRERRFRALVHGVSDLLLVVETDGMLRYATPSARHTCSGVRRPTC